MLRGGRMEPTHIDGLGILDCFRGEYTQREKQRYYWTNTLRETQAVDSTWRARDVQKHHHSAHFWP